VLGGVMPMYNVPGLAAPMRFSAETLVGIYMGEIKKWNDERIANDNPGVTLPDMDITVVYRSDSSGTTSIWTDYLAKVSGTWKSQVGSGNTVKWPTGIGAPGNAGVSSTVQKIEGAVGYVEVGYALGAGFTLPFVKNAAGNYVQPLLANVSAAAAAVKPSSDVQKLATSITNGTDAQAFPITGFTYILVRKDTYTDLNKAQALADFIYRQPARLRTTPREHASCGHACPDECTCGWSGCARRPHQVNLGLSNNATGSTSRGVVAIFYMFLIEHWQSNNN
jgi:phosphate transport system substrate-binding protein